MNMPPCLMHLRIYNQQHNFGIWLPLFLAWIILTILAIVLLPIALILIIVFLPFGWSKFFILFPVYLFNVLVTLRGLKVDINGDKEKVLVSFV